MATVAIVLLCGPVAADDRREAKRLFDEGRALLDAGDLSEACVRFESSFQLDRGAGTALNVAECAEHAGDARRALQLVRFAQQSFERARNAKKARFARRLADGLIARHPWLAKPASADPAGSPARVAKPTPASPAPVGPSTPASPTPVGPSTSASPAPVGPSTPPSPAASAGPPASRAPVVQPTPGSAGPPAPASPAPGETAPASPPASAGPPAPRIPVSASAAVDEVGPTPPGPTAQPAPASPTAAAQPWPALPVVAVEPAPSAPAVEPAAPTHGWSRRRKLLVGGAIAFGVSIVASAYWAYEFYGPIRRYRRLLDEANGALREEYPVRQLDSDDCGILVPRDGDPSAGAFLEACAAKTRIPYAITIAVVAAAAGTGLVIGGFAVSEPSRDGATAGRAPRKQLAIAPMVSPTTAGAALQLAW